MRRSNSLIDDRKAARTALNGPALGNAHSCEAASHIAGFDCCLAVDCQGAVAVARAVERALRAMCKSEY